MANTDRSPAHAHSKNSVLSKSYHSSLLSNICDLSNEIRRRKDEENEKVADNEGEERGEERVDK